MGDDDYSASLFWSFCAMSVLVDFRFPQKHMHKDMDVAWCVGYLCAPFLKMQSLTIRTRWVDIFLTMREDNTM